MKHRADDPALLISQAQELGVALSSPQASTLLEFEGLLRVRGSDLGLVSEADHSRLRERHVLDCLRAALPVQVSDREAYDLGSGAGLPGVVIAVAKPDLHVRLVESRRRRAAFLELAVERLCLSNVSVLPLRIEEVGAPADLCFARALAPLTECWRLARPLLRSGGRLVYFAGRSLRKAPVVPAGLRATLLESSVLESSGPLVIMAQQ